MYGGSRPFEALAPAAEQPMMSASTWKAGTAGVRRQRCGSRCPVDGGVVEDASLAVVVGRSVAGSRTGNWSPGAALLPPPHAAVIAIAATGRQAQADIDAGAVEDGGHHRFGLGHELVERAVAVEAHAEVDLGDVVDAERAGDVDEQADVDAIAVDELDRLERGAPPAYSPPRGCTMWARCGQRSSSSGRATSSVTRPPSSGRSPKGRR